MGHRWRGYEHPELFNMINAGPGAQASVPQTTYWQDLSKELTELDTQLNNKLNSLGASWQGKAAESATSGLTPLAAWASDAETGSSVMKVSSEDQGQFVSDARSNMPEPVKVSTPAPSGWDMAAAAGAAMLGNPGPALDVANQANDHEHQEAAKDAAEQKAVQTMQTYESSSTWNRNTLGTFVPPPDVVVSTPPPQGHVNGVFISSTSVNSVNSNSSGGTTTKSSTGGPTGTSQIPTVNGNQPSGSFSTGGGGNGGLGGAVRPPTVGNLPAQTTSPSQVFVPTAPNGPVLPTGGNTFPTNPTPGPNPFGPPTNGPYPQFVDPNFNGPNANDLARRPLPPLRPTTLPVESGPYGRGPFGGPGGPGGPGGFGVPEGERAPSQLGRGGVLGNAAGEGGVVRSGPGAAGAAGGRGGVNGPVGAGRRADGEEDEEHYSPDYLLEDDDVFGDDRRVAPMVIGE